MPASSASPAASVRAAAVVLLVTNDQAVRDGLLMPLKQRGFDVAVAGDVRRGFATAFTGHCVLVVIDAALPEGGGLQLCRDIRRCGNDVAVLLLACGGAQAEGALGLKAGADDYVTRPFDGDEVVARALACLCRRAVRIAPSVAEAYDFGMVRVDLRRAEVTRSGQPVPLAAKEFLLLRYFIQHRGALVSRYDLLESVWGYDSMPSTRTVDTHVAWLRKKLEPEPHRPRFFLTMHRLGYKFVG